MQKTKKDIKVSVFLDNEMANFIDDSMTYGMRRSDYMRSLVWEKMKRKKPKPSQPSNDPFANPVINGRLIPDDLKDNARLICEWWPIRYKNRLPALQALQRGFLRSYEHSHPKIER